MLLRSKMRQYRQLEEAPRRYYKQTLDRILSVLGVLGTPVLLENIFSSFTNVQLVLLFHGLVKHDHIDGLKTIQHSFNCHFWKQRLKRMEKSNPILRYLNPPDEIGFVQFCELMDRHDDIQLRKSSKVTFDLHSSLYDMDMDETLFLMSTEYICILSEKNAIIMKINMAGANTNFDPIYRITNPAIEQLDDLVASLESYWSLMEPFLIRCEVPYDDTKQSGGEVSLHVAFLPDKPTEYTAFKLHIQEDPDCGL